MWMLISAVTAIVLQGSPVLPVALAFVAVAAVLIPVDLRERRLPRGTLLIGLAVVVGVQVVTAISVGEPRRILAVAVGMVLALVVLLAAHRFAPSGVSLGDAAFAVLAGGTLGWFGPDRVVLGLAIGLVIGAVAAGPITLAAAKDVLALSPGITLRPAMAAGTWIALCWGQTIVAWYSH
jgi:leader peptidase (prepilin peptidase) / N-methyltransferase